jgi:hypothetical protein
MSIVQRSSFIGNLPFKLFTNTEIRYLMESEKGIMYLVHYVIRYSVPKYQPPGPQPQKFTV